MPPTLAKGTAYRVYDDAGTGIMTVRVVTHTVDTHQIALVFDGTSTCQQLPSRLTRLRPVGNKDYRIVFTTCGIA